MSPIPPRPIPNKPAAGTGRLFICGLGINLGADITLGTMKTLKSCDAAYYINGDWRKIKGLVESLCPRFVYFDTKEFLARSIEARAKFAAEMICRDLDKGRKIAFVTYGNPLLFSDALNIIRYCGDRGHKAEVKTAPSSIDSILSLLSEENEIFSKGFLVCHMDQFPAKLESPAARIVMCPANDAPGRDFPGFCAKAEAQYPANHIIYAVKCDDGSGKSLVRTLKISALRGLGTKLIHMMSLVIPGTAGKNKASSRRPRRS